MLFKSAAFLNLMLAVARQSGCPVSSCKTTKSIDKANDITSAFL
jgi:hypothetical protein